MTKKVGQWMVVIGVGVNLIDAFTSKEGQGGIFFGTSGFLRGINSALPLPASLGGIPMNIAGYVAAVGAGIWIYHAI